MADLGICSTKKPAYAGLLPARRLRRLSQFRWGCSAPFRRSSEVHILVVLLPL